MLESSLAELLREDDPMRRPRTLELRVAFADEMVGSTIVGKALASKPQRRTVTTGGYARARTIYCTTYQHVLYMRWNVILNL